MQSQNEFKFPISIWLLYFFVIIAIGVGAGAIIYFTISESSLNLKSSGPSDIIIAIFGLYIPGMILPLVIFCATRLKYVSMKITYDPILKTLNIKRLGQDEEITLKQIEYIEESTFWGMIKIHTARTTVSIPRELNDYLDLYKILYENNLFKNNKNFINTQTTLGATFMFLVLVLLPFIILCIVVPFLTPDNSLEPELLLIPICIGTGILILLFMLGSRFTFTEDELIINKIIYKNRIPYSDISHFYIKENRRNLIIVRKNQKFQWLKTLFNEPGIRILEPGNFSLERIYVELENKTRLKDGVGVNFQHHI